MFALPGKVLKNLFQPPAVPLQSQKDKVAPIARPVARPVQNQQAPKPSQPLQYNPEEKAFGQLPRRIRRIMNLAKEAGYTQGAQIEKQHCSGLWAQKFVKLYEQVDQEKKRTLETKPMEQVFVLVNNLIDKGAI